MCKRVCPRPLAGAGTRVISLASRSAKVCLGRGYGAARGARGRGALCVKILRKEVIQPQVPLRLPCYDFVPITSLTLGRRLHCWLANALRAKPAFMT